MRVSFSFFFALGFAGLAPPWIAGCATDPVGQSARALARAECTARVPELEDWYLIASLNRDRGTSLHDALSIAFISCAAVYPTQFVPECTTCWNRILDAVY